MRKQHFMHKISFLIGLLFVFACNNKDNSTIENPQVKQDNQYIPATVRPILDDIQRNSFQYFYQGANPETGLAYEGTERGPVLTTGATGFGLMSLIVGSERGWISREQAADRTLKIVSFLKNCERFNGVWSHWYNVDGTSFPFGDQIKTGDIVETGLLTAGLIAASEYYTKSEAKEQSIITIIDELWNSINWNFYANGTNRLHWLWYSENNQFSLDVRGWHEAWNTYIFALAAPAPHNIGIDVYKNGWQSNGSFSNPNRSYYGYSLPLGPEYGGPLFLSHYSMLGFNPKQLEDSYANYWQQNVNHVMINRHYCLYDAPKQYKYNESTWGLTACYGAGSAPNYKARSPKDDDGVIAPTAALGSYPYTPFYSTQALLNYYKLPYLKGTYGLGDSFRPMEGKADKRHLGIDQGPIVVMIENYRTGLIWDLVMKNRHVQQGFALAGVSASPAFKEGFHLAVVNTKTGVYDMLIHPDREKYELDFFLNTSGKVKFNLTDDSGKVCLNQEVNALQGANVFSFFDENILRGERYRLSMVANGKTYSIEVVLR